MNTALWIVQILLALVFGLAGFMKLTQPYEKLAENMGYVKDFSPNTIKLIGLVEILGAIGLILPALTGILTFLTTLAAAGLALDMIGALYTHYRRHEYMPFMAINLVLGALAAFVAYGRFVTVPL
jgi:uncharacterized membrane protein YphA (DoxX/SURF4 family)